MTPNDGRPQGWTEADALCVISDMNANETTDFASAFKYGDWEYIRHNYPAEATQLDRMAMYNIEDEPAVPTVLQCAIVSVIFGAIGATIGVYLWSL